jgi:uncharacterized phiE125 gp8 family phage protein
MTLVLTGPPEREPVTLDEAKLHLRIDHDEEDALVSSLIVAARMHLEHALARAFVTQAWSYLLDAWPAGYFVPLPLGPVQAIDSVLVYAEDGSGTPLDPSTYFLDGLGQPPRLVRNAGRSWPAPGKSGNGIAINLKAGHGDLPADVPQPLRQAILLLTAHWYENREPVEIGVATEMPVMLAGLIDPYRRVRL